jgi:MFS family permease
VAHPPRCGYRIADGGAGLMRAVADVLAIGTYRRFLAAAIFSGVGVWIFQTALYWTSLQSGSTGTVGILVATITLPSLLLTIPAGYLTDRVGSFWLLFIGQAAPALACMGGVALVAANNGSLALEPAALVTFVVGAAYALWNVPALVYVTRVVPARLMGSAISLMVLQYAAGRIIGGGLGGVLVGVGGAGLAFMAAAVLFGCGALVALFLPKVAGLEVRSGSSISGMIEAVRWLRLAPVTFALVVLGAITSALAYAYIPLLGALSRDVIGAGSGGLGLLTATSGIGMFASALTANAIGVRLRRGRGVIVAMILGAIAMAALGISSMLWLSILLVMVVAFLGSTRSSLGAFLLQSLSPPRMRGRVASLADFIGQLMSLGGSLAVGGLAVSWGPTAVLVGAAAAIVATVGLVILLSPRILALDVDREARVVVAGRPYVEGHGMAAVTDSL